MHLLLEQRWLSGCCGPWCCSAQSTSSNLATQWAAYRQVTFQADWNLDECTFFVLLSLSYT